MPIPLITRILKPIRNLIRPNNYSLSSNAVADLTRTRSELLLENAFLRQQPIILSRQVKRPKSKPAERFLLVSLSSRLRSWKESLLVAQPDTLLHWHRDLFRIVWKRKSRRKGNPGRCPIPESAIQLIQRMVRENYLWGVNRIRGELLKLGICVARSTIQKYINQVRGPLKYGQSWKTFIRNHAHDTWACDFLHTYDIFFRSIFVLIFIELGSRKITHFAVTRHPTGAWTAEQFRQATPYDTAPRFLIRDNDRKFGSQFNHLTQGVQVIRTPIKAPKANSICERFLGSLRRECLDHIIILNERHLYKTVKEYVSYYNHCRPHQGIDQAIPDGPQSSEGEGEIISIPVLGGLHHDYQRKAA